MKFKHSVVLCMMLLFLISSMCSFATPIKGSGEIDVIAYPMTIVKSESEIIQKHEVRMAVIKNQITAFYHRDDVKSHIDEVMLELIKSLKDPDDAIFTAQRIADNTDLSIEDASILVDYADYFDMDYSLVLALIDAESNFEKYCVGVAADRGYMQIIPATEKSLAEMYGEELGLSYNPDRIFDSKYQMGLGLSYLNELLNKHDGYVHKALSEYNKGPYYLERHYQKYGTYESEYSRNVIKRIDNYTFLD